MKYNIVFKFLAVFLCAAVLLGAIASGAGLLIMVENGLYERSYSEVYEEYLQQRSAEFAHNMAMRYASENLGGATPRMVDAQYGTFWHENFFRWDQYGYTLKDASGNVLDSMELEDGSKAAYSFRIPVSGSYTKVVSTMTEDEYYQQNEQPTEPANRDAQVLVMPAQEDTPILTVVLDYTDGSGTEYHTGEVLGNLHFQNGGELFFESNEIGEIPMGDGWYVNHIVLVDAGGNVVYEAQDDTHVLSAMSMEGSILRLYLPAGTVTAAAPTGTSVTDGDFTSYDAIPAAGTTVASMNVTYGKVGSGGVASEGISSPNLIGTIFHDSQGNVQFRSTDPMQMDIPANAVITQITFWDSQENRIYAASCPRGVGYLEYDEKGYLTFRTGEPAQEEAAAATEAIREEDSKVLEATATVTEAVNVRSIPHANGEALEVLEAGTEVTILRIEAVDGVHWGLTQQGWIDMAYVQLANAPEETIPEETAPPETLSEIMAVSQVPAQVTAQTVPPTEATAETVSAEDIHTFGYYDNETGQHMVAQYINEPMPDYVVEVQLTANALKNQHSWQVIGLIYNFHSYLLPALGICLLVFAICVVYLCCAAGHKPRSKAVRAGGLNRIPLDLYLVGGCGLIVVFYILSMEVGEYLLRSSLNLGYLFVTAMSFLASLTLVGFGFAFVAQIKTPDGYWWRNSLCGRCLNLIGKGSHHLLKGCQWLGENGEQKLIPLTKRIFRAIRKLLTFFWELLVKSFLWCIDIGERICEWIGRNVVRFYSLLPVTWQWLLTGFAMTMMLYIALRSYKVGWILLGFGVFFGIILYGSSAFGILLESAKRMSKGDLDTKVDDRVLIGSFKEFAGELNDLADVAVVAAQKQLKSERMKTELITNVSHDIKTPLTSIINYVDLLEKPHTPQEQEAYLEVLSRQSQRLKKLIDDLMEMSKASTGNMTVEIEVINAAEAINQSLGEFADKLESAQLTPVFRQPEDMVYMLADGRLVWRVMSNLLGNAVKYALPGTRLYVDLAEADGRVIISMKNISRESLNVHADELLERFVRGDASRNTEGSGLGLNIAQSLMELQKGQLQILVDGDLFKVTLIFPGA